MAEKDIDKSSTFNQTSHSDQDRTLNTRRNSAGDIIEGDAQGEQIDPSGHQPVKDALVINQSDLKSSETDKDSVTEDIRVGNSKEEPETHSVSSEEKLNSGENSSVSADKGLRSRPSVSECDKTDSSPLESDINENSAESKRGDEEESRPENDVDEKVNSEAGLDTTNANQENKDNTSDTLVAKTESENTVVVEGLEASEKGDNIVTESDQKDDSKAVLNSESEEQTRERENIKRESGSKEEQGGDNTRVQEGEVTERADIEDKVKDKQEPAPDSGGNILKEDENTEVETNVIVSEGTCATEQGEHTITDSFYDEDEFEDDDSPPAEPNEQAYASGQTVPSESDTREEADKLDADAINETDINEGKKSDPLAEITTGNTEDNNYRDTYGDNKKVTDDIIDNSERVDDLPKPETDVQGDSNVDIKTTEDDQTEQKEPDKGDGDQALNDTTDTDDVSKREDYTSHSDLEKCPAERTQSPARSTSRCSGRTDEVLTKVVIDEDGIPQVTVTTVPDRPPSSQASEADPQEQDHHPDDTSTNTTEENSIANKEQQDEISDKDKDKRDTDSEINPEAKTQSHTITEESEKTNKMESPTNDTSGYSSSDNQVHTNSQDSGYTNIDQQGSSVVTAESSNMKADHDSNESSSTGGDKRDNKSSDNLNSENMTNGRDTSGGSAHSDYDNDGVRMSGRDGDSEQDVEKESDKKKRTESEKTNQSTPANTTISKMDVESKTVKNDESSNEAGDATIESEVKETKPDTAPEEAKVVSPLEQLLQRNVTIDGNAGSINELEMNVTGLLKSMKEVMKHYCEQLKLQSLKDFTEDLGKFRGDLESVNDAFRRCSAMSGHVNVCLKELRVATDDVKMQINRKFQNEDLNTWIDNSPEQEKEKDRLQEESLAEEKAALARASEARHAVATAAVGISEAQKFVGEMEVQQAEADAASKKATAQAKAALVAAEEARVAAAERKRAEEAAKQRAEERARQKAEEERKKREEEEIEIVQDAVRKGTDVEDERERFMREKAQREAERRNPKNWPRYSFKTSDTDFNPAISCIIRAIDGSMRKDDVACSFVDQSSSELTLRENEEIGSNIINIKQVQEDRKFVFEEPVSIALPVCYSRLSLGRDAVIKQQLPSGQWRDLPTAEVQFEDYRELKFLEGRCRGFGKFVVVMRLKKDTVQFAPRGSKVVSSVDSRITFHNKQGNFKHVTSAVVEVQPLDVYVISDLKSRAPTESEGLLTCSPFIRMAIPVKKFVKPLTVTVPLPQAQTKMKRPATSVGRKSEGSDIRPQTARPSTTTDDEPTDDLHLLYKDDKTGWTKNTKIKLIQPNNKDVVVFDQTESYDRFVILRTKTGLKDSAVEKMANLIEKSLSQRNVKVMLRQRSDDAADVMVSCSISNRLDRVIRNCDEEGYTEGPAPSSDLILREGEQLYMKFRGNIRCVTDNPNLNFIFNSHIQTTRKFYVDELDGFAQKSLPCYRGFVQVYTKRLIPRPPAEGAAKNTPPTMVEAEVLLSELLVELPKPEAEPPKPLKTAPMPMKEGPLTSPVLQHVARELGKEWKDVAAQLNLKPMRIQAIMRQNVNKDTPQTRYDMLVTWAKRVPRAGDKVQILCSALQACGRGDLAEEIRYRGEEFKQQRLMSARVSHLRQAFVKVAKTVTICNRWQMFAKSIGVPEEEIEKIEASGGSGQEKCFTSLETWKSTAGENATVNELATHLRSIKQERLSRDVESVMAS